MKPILAIVALVLSSGCSTFGPITATGAPQGKKIGTSCSSWLLFPFLPFVWGRNDIRAAALDGKIETISVVDWEHHWYLVYGESCTNVYGN